MGKYFIIISRAFGFYSVFDIFIFDIVIKVLLVKVFLILGSD